MMDRSHIERVTLARLFNDAVVRYGDLRCQWWKTGPDSTESLTYNQVGWIVKDLTSGLIALGVEKSDRICIMSFNCPRWMWADFAILCAGGVATTIHPTSSSSEMNYIVDNSGARILFVRDQNGIDRVMDCIDNLSTLEKVIVMEDDVELPDHTLFIKLQDVVLMGRKYQRKHPLVYEKRWRSVDLFDWSTIVYTSGTTGKPKGALHTHLSVAAANARDFQFYAKNEAYFDEEHIFLSFLPLSHIYEMQMTQFVAVHKGMTIAYCQQPSTIMEDLLTYSPSYMMCVPRMWERIWRTISNKFSDTLDNRRNFDRAVEIGRQVVDFHTNEKGFIDMSLDKDFGEGLPEEIKEQYVWAEEVVFSKAREVLGNNFVIGFSAAARLNPELGKKFLAIGIRLLEGYGCTEMSNTCCFNHLDKVLFGSVGQFGPGVDGRIASDGELEVRGDNMFLGYFNNPKATAEALTEDGFFKMGDLIEYGPDNYVIVYDRKKGLIILDTGENVSRSKVESQFSTSAAIRQVCAAGDGKPYISGLVVPNYDYFIQYYHEHGIKFDESQLKFQGEGEDRTCIKVGEDFIQKKVLVDMIAQDVEEGNDGLESFEEIKQYDILSRQFTVEMDELTPTLKSKFRNILKHFADEVEELYIKKKERSA